jgi:hypothetical protein
MTKKTTCLLPLTLSVLAIFWSCTQKTSLPDLATIPWVSIYNYSPSEIFSLITTAAIPGPQIPVRVNHESRYILLDINAFGFILKENTFKKSDFEPQRLSNRITETGEALIEEGYLHDVTFLGKTYPLLYVSMLKRGTTSENLKGVIGRNFLADGRLTLDMANKIFGFTTNPTAELTTIYPDTQLVLFYQEQYSDEDFGLMKLPCVIDDQQYLATLDMRHSVNRICPLLARQISGKSAPKKVTIPLLNIGQKQFENVTCQADPNAIDFEAECPDSIQLTLGLELLSRIVLTIDFIESRLLFE